MDNLASILEKTVSDSKIKRFLKGRNREVLVETETNDRLQKKGSKHAVVGLYNYEVNKTITALVDLKTKKIIDVDEAQIQYQLHPEEEREAEHIVSKEVKIKEFLRGRKMNSLVRLYFPNDAAKHNPPHRYAIVFIRPSNTERKFAVVDLSEQKITKLLGINELCFGDHKK
jgi:Cu2+-containing amine oxidase